MPKKRKVSCDVLYRSALTHIEALESGLDNVVQQVDDPFSFDSSPSRLSSSQPASIADARASSHLLRRFGRLMLGDAREGFLLMFLW